MSEEEKENLRLFLKTGLAILTCILLLISAIVYLPKVMPTGAGRAAVWAKKLPIYCVDTQEKKIAISFDAAWGNEDTAQILEILKQNDVRATFFMTGDWMEKYPEDVKAIYEAGHDLGNHSENHKQMSKLSAAQCKEELQKAHEKIRALLGVEMTLFRPPYGDYNDTVITAANELGYHVIQWDVDSLDWKDYGAESIIRTVCGHKHLGNGSIILMHNGAKYTAQALDTLIKNLKEQGYVFVPISELIYTEDYEMDHEGRQHKKTQDLQSGESVLR